MSLTIYDDAGRILKSASTSPKGESEPFKAEFIVKPGQKTTIVLNKEKEEWIVKK